jgi:hypothetical protein
VLAPDPVDSSNSSVNSVSVSTPSGRLPAPLSNRVTPRPDARPFAELLMDCEEDRTLRAVLVGVLREAED